MELSREQIEEWRVLFVQRWFQEKDAAELNALCDLALRGLAVTEEGASDGYEEALQRIAQWADAYPLDIFPEPDFAKVRELLAAGGITVDAVSASCMRHVIEGVGKIVKGALSHDPE